MRAGAIVVILLAGVGCRHGSVDEFVFSPRPLTPQQSAAVAQAPLGSEKNPVRCEQPRGQRAYLQRLRCPSGEAPGFERLGSVGRGPYGTIMDAYAVRCPGREEPWTVFMDMYHDGVIEDRPIDGLSILPGE